MPKQAGINRRAALLAMASLTLCGCVNVMEPPGPAIDMTRLPGWTGDGSEDVYTCGATTTACAALQIVTYQAVPATPADLAALKAAVTNPEAFEAAPATAFLLQNSGAGVLTRTGTIETASINGVQGVAIPVGGANADGSLKDHGIVLVLPGKTVFHAFTGVAKSRKEARDAVRVVATALDRKLMP
ncbi:MAG: hypothetical protein HC779_03850 [Phyllobacteriaceae bacterium]|nr:hypothetical protein [Phyllobacteriaceae bacterium]